ncbi:MAG: putative Methyltransferase [Candidatus Saccharibacteria bacterium]|nr:putative Methyltransferase [Candidatus Saccharibacteria bacterium]
MNIRVIAGRYGGRVIEGSGTQRTHPMSERIRNALFNSLGSEIEGKKVLDVFAGSGALGLEALSRGAEQVTFIERDRIAQRIIEKNIATLGVQESAKLVKASASAFIGSTAETYDIIFADPPFRDTQFSTVTALFSLLKPDALMVLSYPGSSEMPTANGVVVVDNRSYGTAALAFYRKKDA